MNAATSAGAPRKLESYLAGAWGTGQGAGEVLVNPVNGVPLATASSEGLDLTAPNSADCAVFGSTISGRRSRLRSPRWKRWRRKLAAGL